jgi:exodeoxyribonuclease V alpha subunit
MSKELETVFGPYTETVAGSGFRPIDRALGALLWRMDENATPELALAGAVASRARGRGDVCFHLSEEKFQPQLATEHGLLIALPARADWLASLRGSSMVGDPGDFQPLILDDKERLYLHRMHDYESGLAQTLRDRAGAEPAPREAARFRAALPRFFEGSMPSDDGIHRQYVAAYVGLTRRLAIITGGPGTGKTHVAGRLLTLGIHLGALDSARIALAAPTGKAAARLKEQITKAFKEAAERKLLDDIPSAEEMPEARTLHRLLGASSDGSRFRHDENKPLPYDVILVDEASMIDLLMMARLFRACAKDTRVILLGDPDQLASVEAGSVLADICGDAHDLPATPDYTAAATAATGQPLRPLQESNPLGDCVVRLDLNHRVKLSPNGSSRDSLNAKAITDLAAHINAGDAGAALACMEHQDHTNLTRDDLPAPYNLTAHLLPNVREVFKKSIGTDGPKEALEKWESYRVLTAMRRGPFGAPRLNQQLERALLEEGVRAPGEWYHGRPIIITRNNYPTRLFNGDLGIAWEENSRLNIYFLNARGELRPINPGRLPAHESAYALTVHKAQGSEFDCVRVVLPSQMAPVLTRELVYTGITRARSEVALMAPKEILAAAIEVKTSRASGLRDALWG